MWEHNGAIVGHLSQIEQLKNRRLVSRVDLTQLTQLTLPYRSRYSVLRTQFRSCHWTREPGSFPDYSVGTLRLQVSNNQGKAARWPTMEGPADEVEGADLDPREQRWELRCLGEPLGEWNPRTPE